MIAGVKFGRKPKLSPYQRAEAIKNANIDRTELRSRYLDDLAVELKVAAHMFSVVLGSPRRLGRERHGHDVFLSFRSKQQARRMSAIGRMSLSSMWAIAPTSHLINSGATYRLTRTQQIDFHLGFGLNHSTKRRYRLTGAPPQQKSSVIRWAFDGPDRLTVALIPEVSLRAGPGYNTSRPRVCERRQPDRE
jgi:hypothetical protein